MSERLDVVSGEKPRDGGASSLLARSQTFRSRVFSSEVKPVTGWALALAMFFFYAAHQPGTISTYAIGALCATTLPLAIVALGEGVVILTAGVDLSVGGVLSLGTVIAATRFTDTGNSILWSFVILIIGIGAGCLNGFIIGRLHLQPFIVTLATWSIFDGVALIILPIQGGTVPGGFAAWINNSAFKVPNAVWALLVLAVLWLWFRRTRTAAHIYALGSNREAAIIAGVNPTRTLIRAYAISGFCAALASIAYAMLTASGSPTAGDALILPAVAAVVIGGTSLSGGRGGFIGTIAGALALTLLGDVVFVLNLSSYWTQFASGLLLLVAVLFGVVVERLQARRVSVQLT